jgi:1,4-dihydroxy-2-naphthoate octaprenyltransferase
MVMGTAFVLTGNYTWTSFFASLIPFFLVSNLLLLNQFPDVEPDKSIGRKHFPVVIGRKKSSIIFGAFYAFTFLSVGLGTLLHYLPGAGLLALLTLVLAVPVALKAYKNADNIPKLVPLMGLNVVINLVTPILLSIGLFVGR